jgi:hypothetical protein
MGATEVRYRSGLEKRTAQYLRKHKVKFEYETLRIKFQPPMRTYTPDFVLPNGIIIETKGRFIPSDRAKHLMIKEQHPEYDIRFVFTNPKAKISKGSKTSYGDWCDRYGFLYAQETIPLSWIKEKRS